MTKQEKVQEIQDLTSEITSVKNLYLTDIAGLDAIQTTALDELVSMQISDYQWLKIPF